jgi:heme a synthase
MGAASLTLCVAFAVARKRAYCWFQVKPAAKPPSYARQTPPPVFHHRPLHYATLMTALLAFPLVWMGGLVTSHGAGMSVPDWPNSYGYNMFALPFSMWLGAFAGGTFYEHAHRLLGTLVGLAVFTGAMLAWAPSRHYHWRRTWGGAALLFGVAFIGSLVASKWARLSGSIDESTYKYLTHVFSGCGALAVTFFIMWRCRTRDPLRWRRWAVTALLGLIVIQGLMGGFRVTEISLWLARLHGIFGQIVFASAAGIAVTTSRWWLVAPRRQDGTGKMVRRLALLSVGLICTQLVLGALMRHDPLRSNAGGGAGLSIPDWPLHFGNVIPPTDEASLARANQYRIWKITPPLPPTTLSHVWLQFSHRVGAYATALVVLGMALHVWRKHEGNRALLQPALTAALLVVVQVTLGILTVLYRKPADIATFHQATGALLLMTVVVLLVRVLKQYPFSVRRKDADFERSESRPSPMGEFASPVTITR